jgi:uracil-DNA glycosylase family 4
VTRNEKITALLALNDKYGSCTDCKLHRMRRGRSMRGTGNPDARVLFILERASPEEAKTCAFLTSGRYNLILDTLFGFSGKRKEDYWLTPLVACPTTIISDNTRAMPIEATPVPKSKEIAACRPRIHAEINIVAPELVVAMGQAAARPIIHKEPLSLNYNLGEIHEGLIDGETGTYPVPVLLTHSLHALLTQPDLASGGIWNKTAGHIALAFEIVEYLGSERWPV